MEQGERFLKEYRSVVVKLRVQEDEFESPKVRETPGWFRKQVEEEVKRLGVADVTDVHFECQLELCTDWFQEACCAVSLGMRFRSEVAELDNVAVQTTTTMPVELLLAFGYPWLVSMARKRAIKANLRGVAEAMGVRAQSCAGWRAEAHAEALERMLVSLESKESEEDSPELVKKRITLLKKETRKLARALMEHAREHCEVRMAMSGFVAQLNAVSPEDAQWQLLRPIAAKGDSASAIQVGSSRGLLWVLDHAGSRVTLDTRRGPSRPWRQVADTPEVEEVVKRGAEGLEEVGLAAREVVARLLGLTRELAEIEVARYLC